MVWCVEKVKVGKVVGKDVEKVKLGCDPVEIKSCVAQWSECLELKF